MSLQAIIKLTRQQYDILYNGGTVGSYTGLDHTKYLYLIQEDYEFPVTTTARKILMSTSTAGLVEWQNLTASDIPALAASKITSGTFDTARIPNLDASKITSGTFADARIASASTWNAKYTKPSGGIPASDLAESYSLSTHNHDTRYLKLSGGAMIGNISYQGSLATNAMIKFLNNTSDAYGNGIAIGGGGIVVIGAGESSDLSYGSAGDENLYLAADTNIHFYSNAQNGLSSAKHMIFDTSGVLQGMNSIVATHTSGGGSEYRIISNTYSLSLMIGSGDVNRGIYDHTNENWMIYRDDTTNIYLNGAVYENGIALSTRYAAKSHTHTKSQITDFPSSMPANGGNSDTVDYYHAEELLAFGNYKYHDIAAFCNASTPLYEVSADGSTGWTEATLNKDIFAAKENYSFQVTNTSQKGARFTWKGGISWSLISYCVIGWPWQQTGATVTLKFESSADSGATWRDLGTVTGITASSASALYSFSNPNGDAWFRLSIIQTSSTGTKAIATIKLLTSRWGDQGLGSEYEKPYVSDGEKTIRPWSNNTQLLGTSSYRWKEIHGITIYENGSTLADIYLGKTAKAADADKLDGQDSTYYLNYNNLSNKPTIPSVSNATITIKQTGISDQTFTLNGSATTITLADTNTWRPLGTGANDACAGNDSRLSNARPASDVYDWAKASTKPSYTHNEIGAGNLTVGSGNYYLNMRSGHASYNGGIYYSTPGNEAIVFANKNSVTSWIFATTDVTGMANWTTLTPSMQIKNGKVVINKLIADGAGAAYNLDVNGTLNATTIYQNGSTLADTYLGISAKAADSSKLDGHALSYFITTDNIASQSVYHAANSDYAIDADNSNKLNGNGPAYYLNYNNFTNTPSSVLYTSQTLTDAQKTQARSNIGAGTSSFTGYTSSNKLSTNYIQNDAGWSSFSGYSSSNKLHTDYINNAAGWTSVTESTVSGWGFTKNAGTVTQVKVGTTAYNPSSGVISLPAYPTKSSWNYDDVYIKLTGNQSITGLKSFNNGLAVNGSEMDGYYLKIFEDNELYALLAIADGTDDDFVIKLTKDGGNTFNRYNFHNEGTAYSYYVATEEWVDNNYSRDNHAHTLSITSGGSSPTTLAANTTYTLTAGGSTFVFKTPPSSSGNYLPLSGGTITGSLGVTQGFSVGGGVMPYSPQSTTNFLYGYGGSYIQESRQQVDVVGDVIALYTTDEYRSYSTVLAVHNEGYGIALKAHFAYTDNYQAVLYDRGSFNAAVLNIYAEDLLIYPSSVNSSLTNKFTRVGVVEHNIKITYSTTLYVRLNFRGDSCTETAATSMSILAQRLYTAGHRSAATALHCSGRYTNYQYCVTAIYAYNTTTLRVIYLGASGISEAEYSVPSSSTVTDTLTYKLVA